MDATLNRKIMDATVNPQTLDFLLSGWDFGAECCKGWQFINGFLDKHVDKGWIYKTAVYKTTVDCKN